MPSQPPEGLQGREWAPYCGAAPAPSELLGRWNLDPAVLAVLALAGIAFALHRAGGGKGRDGLLALAAAVLTIAFVSPLCALSSALFSARVAHHGLLVVVAAPLLAFGLPPQDRLRPSLAAVTGVHAVTLWAWHAPGPYAWALSHDLGYWIMQATLLGSAMAFWGGVRRAGGLPAAAALLATLIQTGLLGALITFASEPLYAPHLRTTLAFGLSPLADQQLAGLIMWAPMAGAYLLAALALVGRTLEPNPALERPA